MNKSRQRWERPDFQEHPLGAEVTAYLTSPITTQTLTPTSRPTPSLVARLHAVGERALSRQASLPSAARSGDARPRSRASVGRESLLLPEANPGQRCRDSRESAVRDASPRMDLAHSRSRWRRGRRERWDGRRGWRSHAPSGWTKTTCFRSEPSHRGRALRSTRTSRSRARNPGSKPWHRRSRSSSGRPSWSGASPQSSKNILGSIVVDSPISNGASRWLKRDAELALSWVLEEARNAGDRASAASTRCDSSATFCGAFSTPRRWRATSSNEPRRPPEALARA